MDSACSTTFSGLLNVDSVIRRGNTNYYDVLAQHTTTGHSGSDGESKQIDVAIIVYADTAPFSVNDVIHASGTWIPTANPFLSMDSFTVLLRGENDLPDDFEPAAPTIFAICFVVDINEAAGLIKVRMIDYDRRVSRRTSADINILRVGRRWDKTAWPRVGTAIQVRGTIHSQNDVTSIFSIQADAIGFLPISLAADTSGTPSPKKRKFARKVSSVSDSTPLPPNDEEFTPPPSEPATPTPAAAPSTSRGKGRSR
ncbi:hypothetical protein OC845_006093 [Tilletia horrida]|nr:hypothetical protein OC845_006093 [Tilletia horrida]